MQPTNLSIDILSDPVCPWCYIGKRQLDRAIEIWRARNPDATSPIIEWHPFQLNPQMPAAGLDRAEYMRAKFGAPDGGTGYARVLAAASHAGLELRPERIRRQPSTRRAHALLRQAAGSPLQHDLAESIFRAFFVDGEDIGDENVLRRIASVGGLAEASIDAAFESTALASVDALDSHFRGSGIGGVPYFVIGRRVALSGAQGVDALLDAFDRIPAQG